MKHKPKIVGAKKNKAGEFVAEVFNARAPTRLAFIRVVSEEKHEAIERCGAMLGNYPYRRNGGQS